jgi:hypothetical protein
MWRGRTQAGLCLACFFVSTIAASGAVALQDSHALRERAVRLRHGSTFTGQSLSDIVRVAQRVAENQLFELTPNCGDSCALHIKQTLEHHLNCTDVQYLKQLRMMEGSCDGIETLSPTQVGELAESGLDGIKRHFDNEHVSIPTRESPTEARDAVPAAQRFGVNFSNASSRWAQHVSWTNWGLDRIDQYGGVGGYQVQRAQTSARPTSPLGADSCRHCAFFFSGIVRGV